MSRFLQCLPLVLAEEGGYVHHPLDGGGATDRGVTQAVYDEYRASAGLPLQPVRGIGSAEVEAVYMRYWKNAKCDLMPEPLDLLIFDVAINSGPVKAIVLLQRALGMKPQHHTGNFGPITTKTLAEADVMEVCAQYLRERVKFYNNLVLRNSTQSVFIDGWLRRVAHMAKHVGLDEGSYA